MKKISVLALMLSLAFTLSAQAQAGDGPGSGNGDGGLMITGSVARGMDEFHTLLYAFEHGSKPEIPKDSTGTNWGSRGASYSYLYPGVLSAGLIGGFALFSIDRGPLLPPILQACYSSSCTSDKMDEVVYKGSSLVLKFERTLYRSSNSSHDFEIRIFKDTAIVIVRPDANGQCEGSTVTENICEIGWIGR